MDNKTVQNLDGLAFERFSTNNVMRIRTRHVADSVIDRIHEATQAFESGRTPAIAKPTNSNISQQTDGDAKVESLLSDGTLESMTVESPVSATIDQPIQEPTQEPEIDTVGLDESGLDVGTVLSGGNALDAILQS